MSGPQDPFVERDETNQQHQMEQARPLETASNGDCNRLIDHDDNWRELEDEKDQVFVGGVRNYYYKSKGRWIPQRDLFNFAKLDQEHLGSSDFRSMHHPLTPPQVPPLPSVIGDRTAGKDGAYPFAPLPSEEHARFLEILPADSGELRCRLHTAKILDCRLGYEYLSYSTDKSIHASVELNQDRMVINGSSGQSREVLIRLLETLRLPDRSRLIWAPHLCIDVADVNDRNRHTKRAAKIIQSATDAGDVASKFKVDYGVKEPQLNHSVACHLAEMDGPASFLGQVHHDHDGRLTMRVSNNDLSLVVDGPSWVPRWQTALSDPIEPLVPHADFSAGTALRPRILKQPDPNRLVVRGILVDEVDSVRSLDRYNTFWRGRDASTYSKHVNFDLNHGPASPTLKAPPRLERAMLGDELRACGLTTIDLSQLAVTLSCGKDWEGTPVSNIEGHVADYARCILRNGLWWSLDWLRKIKRQQGTDPGQKQAMSVSDLEALSTGGSADRFLDCAVTAGRNRATFVSKHGIWGLGPDAMKQGDRLCVVSGLSAPLVLRPNNHKDSSFQVVGPAYAFDMMHGEVAEVAQSENGWLTESWIQLN
ncbi:uncharacterized protein J7T54_007320 [Emericellopsis cladophorae]|uniref:Heterokaryon incompatibility domain-containing protein n=1 Tax=Emericellopsis cladophorae TaxID=2686198 RepID=A0A9P9Y047_9HYPO|nr:uncharacterized protein J7T54_007320 [Emericellopsis cladophorae]KAI6780841.1 hypothetical protein J7T54_007320 [Emericellopsis cladophorae]